MKSIFYTLAAAAMLCGLSNTASATDSGKAVAAQFQVQGSNKPTEFTPVNYMGGGKKGGVFGNFEPIANQEYQWQVLNIPVRVGAGKVAAPGGDKVIATCVPEITFHVYVRVEANVVDKNGKSVSDKRKSCITLDKEITYVNIPLKKANGNVTVGTVSVDSYADMQVAVFLSPADVSRVMDDETSPNGSMGGKTQPKVKVAAIAMEATYKGATCWRTPKNEKTDYLVVDSSVCNGLPDRWWKKNGTTKGAVLSCISETPFAADYYPYYCATKPMFGAGTPSASSGSSEPDDSSSGTATDGAGDDDTTAGDTPEADDSASDGDSRKNKRNKKDKKKGK